MPDYTELSVSIVKMDHLDLYGEAQSIAVENLQKHGALACRFYVSKETDNEWTEMFPDYKHLQSTHVAVFLWTTYKTLKHRNEVRAAIAADKGKRIFSGKIDAYPAWNGNYETFLTKGKKI